MSATESTDLISTHVHGPDATNEKCQLSLAFFWLHVSIDDKNGSLPKAILAHQERIRSLMANIELTILDNTSDLQNCIYQMPLIKKVFLILNDSAATNVIPLIHDFCQVVVIFVYNNTDNARRDEENLKDFNKIRYVTLERLVPLVKAFYARWLRFTIESFSFDIFQEKSDTTLDRSSTDIHGSYLFSRLLIDAILKIKFNPSNELNEFVDECTKKYINQPSELKTLKAFYDSYSPRNALHWYTMPSFVYMLLNKALRVQNIDLLFLYRFFIRDMQIQLAENQYNRSVKVYRGQLMFKHELNELKKYVHQKISINAFFSTSLSRTLAMFYIGQSETFTVPENNVSICDQKKLFDNNNPDEVLRGEVAVLFEIEAHPCHLVNGKKPFADITPFSQFLDGEQEILFMLGTVFRVEEVREDRDGVWMVRLSLCNDEVEHEMQEIFEYMKNEFDCSTEGDTTGLMTLCSVLLAMGKLDTAEKFLKRTVTELAENDTSNRARCYYQLGNIALHRNQYDHALTLFSRVLQILPIEHSLIPAIHSCMGNTYRYQQNYDKAMESLNKALTIYRESSDQNQLSIAMCYVDLGSLHRAKQNFDTALSYYQKALTIQENCTSVPHSSTGNTHAKIARIYLDRQQMDLALHHSDRAFEICSTCLPRDHPLLSKVYHIAALTHQNLDTGRKTIDLYDRACVANNRETDLPKRWAPFGIRLYRCPRCSKMVWIYNVFGLFHGWSCFACMRKLVTRRSVQSKRKPVVLTEDSQDNFNQRILQKSYAFHEVSQFSSEFERDKQTTSEDDDDGL